ncbi:hypothetical protein GCM10028797_02750 [Dyella agri]
MIRLQPHRLFGQRAGLGRFAVGQGRSGLRHEGFDLRKGVRSWIHERFAVYRHAACLNGIAVADNGARFPRSVPAMP